VLSKNTCGGSKQAPKIFTWFLNIYFDIGENLKSVNLKLNVTL